MRDYSKTVLIVTHDPRAAQHAKVVLHLEKGILIEGQQRERQV
jgi:putative ABC transport system ATP-binding protein